MWVGDVSLLQTVVRRGWIAGYKGRAIVNVANLAAMKKCLRCDTKAASARVMRDWQQRMRIEFRHCNTENTKAPMPGLLQNTIKVLSYNEDYGFKVNPVPPPPCTTAPVASCSRPMEYWSPPASGVGNDFMSIANVYSLG